jgi:D-alanyl-D-alanine dipeptidase
MGIPTALIHHALYATVNNFVVVQWYPADARCLVHESLAPVLAVAANQPCAQANTLVFWDCYRPHDVQARTFQDVPNPNGLCNRVTTRAATSRVGVSQPVPPSTVADSRRGEGRHRSATRRSGSQTGC